MIDKALVSIENDEEFRVIYSHVLNIFGIRLTLSNDKKACLPPGRIAEAEAEKVRFFCLGFKISRESRMVDLDENFLYCASSISTKRTGLPFIVWISCQGGESPRVWLSSKLRIESKFDLTTVQIEPRMQVLDGGITPEAFVTVCEWVEMNRATLLRHWNGETDSVDALDQIRGV
jgi:hypothetical protein